ncbi:hypothetical protein QQ045_023910 [Rhodiola kirilowii]
MARKKVTLAFIDNDSARKTTYKKRKRGIMKKMTEISTLCGVEACCIIYSPYDAQAVLWPPSDVDVQRVLARFRTMPEMEQSKKMVNQETFLRGRIMKLKDQLKKQLKDNREQEMVEVMFQCLIGQLDMAILCMMDFNDLVWLIDQYLREIEICSERFRKAWGNAGQANAAGGADLVVDRKPQLMIPGVSVSPPMISMPFFPHGAGPSAYAGIQNNAPWLSGGFINHGSASSSSNQPQFGLPRANNNPMMMMPPPQQQQPGIDPQTSNAMMTQPQPGQPSGVVTGVSSSEMVPPPPPQFNMGGMWPNNPNFFNN